MHNNEHIWALVLAAGEGSRLRSLTMTPGGTAIPKQFCSLRGGPSLLDDALERAAAVAPGSQLCAVVADQHRQWWHDPLRRLPDANVFAQPENRGTAHGILLPLLQIAARDPDAIVVLLPADHHVRDEPVLADSLRRACNFARSNTNALLLLGVQPDQPDSELGYIVPSDRHRTQPARVRQFVEKPPRAQASALLARGALWNVFIIAAPVRALLALFELRIADTVRNMRAALASEAGAQADALTHLYQNLANVDFSRDILEGQEAKLRVLPVPQCGWSDLGTPERVAQTLQQLPGAAGFGHGASATRPYLNLAAAHLRLQSAAA
jgi:mannose-1-phosphate guanylyltransferase